MKMNKDVTKIYESSDLFLTAFLLAKGFHLNRIHKLTSQKVSFVLEDSPAREKLVSDFFAGKASVDPLRYQNQLRNLKSLIYETKREGLR